MGVFVVKVSKIVTIKYNFFVSFDSKKSNCVEINAYFLYFQHLFIYKKT